MSHDTYLCKNLLILPYNDAMESDGHPKKIQVFYDGKCPMCTVVMDTVGSSSKKDSFDLRDMHTEAQLPFDRAAIEKEIHVIDENGTTLKGADAILVMM